MFAVELRRLFLWAGALLILPLAYLPAQLSPGDLHQSHAFLEGLSNCTQCHSAGAQIAVENCLACHTLLKARIDAGKGLHANPEYRKCVNCHSDHHGRNFKLIHWKEGEENFEHGLTGYQLEGAHAKLQCRDCHKPANIANQTVLLEKKKNLEQTFLGLQQDCLSCHHDEHRGQMKKDCLSCHNMDAWKPSPGFDHNKTRFVLTGKHRDVACEKCHPSVTDNRFPNDPSFLKFAVAKFAACTDCHEDVHKGQFGLNCTSCHSTAGWNQINEARFNHDKTRFPLKGKHRQVQCESCHKPGRPRRGLKFAKCTDCHSDFHQGQFAKRASRGACEECHSVEGYSPSSFTLEKHQQTDYPLLGAHQAIPCIACHAGGPRQKGASRSMLKVNRFTFSGTACQDCHKDPHFGEVDKYKQAKGCESCHAVESWRRVSFDHNQTGFELRDRHAEIACRDCHKPVAVGTPRERLQIQGLAGDCQSCHQDVHQGQFEHAALVGGKTVRMTDCSRCHSAYRWQPDKFDHNRHSRFPLEGGHEKVPCQDCHPKAERNGAVFAVYKPLGTECSNCHGK